MIIMPITFFCLLVCLFGLVLRREEKKASLLQSYDLIVASGNSIRQKPISFSIALVHEKEISSVKPTVPKHSLLSLVSARH